ncbi:YbgA family protein [Pseudomonas zhanjiangensis]|uniref:YbgA family protein n=1 Tax=Pseudomonas zhanjiangensis TaxID=3239015 RepID=A0ABV3YR11_9PSED
MPLPSPTQPKIRVAISACLLGQEVRYNGGHKASRLCRQSLSEHFDFVPLCPEMAIGLGVPREPIRLIGDPAAPRAVGTVARERDHTQALAAYGRRMAAEQDGICGYIFMQQSPSCGLERVKVYQDGGRPSEPRGRGIYAEAFCAQRPDLPVEEDGRLNDPVLRENFLTRVYVYADWQQRLRAGLTRKALLDFHARYKYLLMAHHPLQYKALGRLLGNLQQHDLQDLAPRYFSALMTALKQCATRRTHSNVLQHLSGYFKRALSGDDKQELQQLIGQYRAGIVPLVVPLTLLKHHLRRHPDRYLAQQAYLQPHPENLSLRNAL